MKGSLGELHPSRAVARRMHELETELQQARTHLRQLSKSPDTLARWGLDQPAQAEQEEGWFLTYLDMMTLLLVVMIVMLAFSGTFGERAGAVLDSFRTAVVTPVVETEPGTETGTDTPQADADAPVTTAVFADPEPITSSVPATATAPAPDSDVPIEPDDTAAAPPAADHEGDGLLPGGAGLLPGKGDAPVVQSGDGAATPSAAHEPALADMGRPAHPADVGPLPRDALVHLGSHVPAPEPESTGRSTDTLYPGFSAADLAASFIGPPRPEWLMAASTPSVEEDVTDATPAPAAAPAPTEEDDPVSEGELLAADLQLGELGGDVEVIVSERTVSFRVNSEILFDTSQADLSRSGLAVLRNIVKVLARNNYEITVEGHTDSVPVRRNVRFPSNWELSSARAGSVVRYLQANGIDRTRLKAVGYADTRPIADNHTPDGRARNRRVELVIEKRHQQ
ncbi:OmpA family protein [Yanghanlia caeni]|uniref:OmpA family protein n=1 Tax=Yanghanlia caeni TaxID=3064283 RepID=A0ABU1D6V0_9BURK|nr:OmpA family protein [Alcaligenaceae bacterium LG-2]NGR08856.1 OmpA family protein [bacterium SGD-2]